MDRSNDSGRGSSASAVKAVYTSENVHVSATSPITPASRMRPASVDGSRDVVSSDHRCGYRGERVRRVRERVFRQLRPPLMSAIVLRRRRPPVVFFELDGDDAPRDPPVRGKAMDPGDRARQPQLVEGVGHRTRIEAVETGNDVIHV